MVKYLVEKHGCDPSGKDDQGYTPLNVAAFSGSLDILMYLIEERKCSPGCPGRWGRSPLHNACGKNGNLAMVKYLVEKHGCDPSGKDDQGSTPLHVAALSGSLDILMYLLKKETMVKYLVEKHGCDPLVKDDHGDTPLHVAALSGSLDILMYLVEERKCSPGCPGQWGRSALHYACGKNWNLAMVKYLWRSMDVTPLGRMTKEKLHHVAAFSGSLDILMYLIEERKCSPGCPGQWGRSSLHNACDENGNLAMVKYLVEKHGCDPLVKDDHGDTPLNVAALSGSLDILMYLIEERKCSPGCPGRWGRSPLHNACGKNGNLAMVKYLVEKHGCDPLGRMTKEAPTPCGSIVRKDDQDTPLHVAALSGSLDILMYLLKKERKCSPGCPGQWGRSPLHMLVERMESSHGEVPGRSMDVTPLGRMTKENSTHVAAFSAMVKYLVEKHGCDPLGRMIMETLHSMWQHCQGLPSESTVNRDERTRQWIPQTLDGVHLQWDHPAVQNNLGPMLPDWCTFQKWNGDIVFVNMETATTIQEDPRAAHQRYKDALKDGSVSAKVMKILIIGAAGVGKTHLFHLLLNQAPPEVRHSTPVMEKPVQVIQTALRSILLKNVTDQELASREASVNIQSTLNNANVGLHMYDDEYVDSSNVDNPHLLTEAEKPKLQLVNNSDDPPELLKVEEQLVPYIASTKDSAPILDVDWIYFIDSGGQPQFHQLLPAFMHHTNLNIFVLRLCDKLSDHPTVKYYDEGGTCIYSTPSLLTNKEILQRCAQATQTVDQEGVSKLLIVGTHRDLEDQCHGTIQENKCVVLSLQECSQVAIRLHMVDDTKAALQFFSDLNVILYYPSILPNVVFIHSASLTLFLRLLNCAFDRKWHFNGMLVRANHEGIISEKLLEYLRIESPKTHKEYKIFYLSVQIPLPQWHCARRKSGANAELWLQENKQAEVDDHTPNLGDLMNDVAAVIPAKWRLVGVQLKLPNGTLDEIQAQNTGRPDECILSFEQVFATWRSLGTSLYTWKTVINALRSPAVGEVTLANELNAKMHPRPCDQQQGSLRETGTSFGAAVQEIHSLMIGFKPLPIGTICSLLSSVTTGTRIATAAIAIQVDPPESHNINVEIFYPRALNSPVSFDIKRAVSPRAKMNQQRGRRFCSAREAQDLIRKAQQKGKLLPSEPLFDSNCSTPGTDFMSRLHEQL
eukprot:Em0959g1a